MQQGTAPDPRARPEQVTDKSGFMKTPKLRLELAGDQRSYVTIGFPKGGKNEFLKALTAAIAGAKRRRTSQLCLTLI